MYFTTAICEAPLNLSSFSCFCCCCRASKQLKKLISNYYYYYSDYEHLLKHNHPISNCQQTDRQASSSTDTHRHTSAHKQHNLI